MGLFDPAWVKLHKRIADQYEELAFRDHARHPDQDADFVSIVSRILETELRTDPTSAQKMAAQLHDNFLSFPMKPAVEEFLRSQNPHIPDHGVEELFQAVKSRFLDTQYEHMYFLFFVISYLIAAGDYGITRGQYFMEIARGNIPEDKSRSKVRKRTRLFESFLKAEDERSQPEN